MTEQVTLLAVCANLRRDKPCTDPPVYHCETHNVDICEYHLYNHRSLQGCKVVKAFCDFCGKRIPAEMFAGANIRLRFTRKYCSETCSHRYNHRQEQRRLGTGLRIDKMSLNPLYFD